MLRTVLILLLFRFFLEMTSITLTGVVKQFNKRKHKKKKKKNTSDIQTASHEMQTLIYRDADYTVGADMKAVGYNYSHTDYQQKH